jgi:RNA-binding protein
MLDPARRRALRARAHHLRPVVTIGAAGLSPPVAAETQRALDAHELLKVKLPAADRDDRRALAEALCAQTGADLVQLVGRIAVLYRPREGEP